MVKARSQTLRILGIVAVATFAAAAIALFSGAPSTMIERARWFQRHQRQHVLANAASPTVRGLLTSESVAWSFENFDDPFVTVVTASWRDAAGTHGPRWVVRHDLTWTGRVKFLEIAALSDEAHQLTPRVERRDALIAVLR